MKDSRETAVPLILCKKFPSKPNGHSIITDETIRSGFSHWKFLIDPGSYNGHGYNGQIFPVPRCPLYPRFTVPGISDLSMFIWPTHRLFLLESKSHDSLCSAKTYEFSVPLLKDIQETSSKFRKPSTAVL